MEGILSALGVAPFKRRIMASHQGSTNVIAQGNDAVYIQNHLPMNIVVGAQVPLGGKPFIHQVHNANPQRWYITSGITMH